MNRAPRALDLEFRGAKRSAPWAAWALLAIAAGFTADLAVSYRDVQEAIAKAQTRLAGLERPRNGAGAARARQQNISPEEIAQARDTYARLSTPWNDLFGALESTIADKVTLLAIEPDTKSGTVMISGEGRDYPAVLEYVVGLQGAKVFDRVHLVRHEIRQNDPQRAAAFSVSAAWKEVRQ